MPAKLRRQIMLGVALSATVAASFWVGHMDEGDKASATSGRRSVYRAGRIGSSVAMPAALTAGENDPNPASLGRGDFTDTADDLFASRSWRPPPPPPPPAVTIKPTAPPLPFRYGGKLDEDGRITVFLAQQNSLQPAKVGDTINGVYRIDAITPAGVEFTYLPLNEKQFLGLYR